MFFKKKSKQEKLNLDKTDILDLEKFSDINPIAEADVYIAYGREKQALEILNNALEKGIISEKQYNDFLLKNVKKIEEKELIKNQENYLYYVSITYIALSRENKARFELNLHHKIETKCGIAELETKIKEKINTEQWSLDSFIKIVN